MKQNFFIKQVPVRAIQKFRKLAIKHEITQGEMFEKLIDAYK